MRRTIIIVCLVCQALFLQACKMVNNYTTDISEYGLWKDSMCTILQENFVATLPEKEIVNKYGESYYCRHEQSVLGDESIVVYVELHFQDEGSYKEVLSKYTALSSNFISQENTIHYTIQYSKNAVLEYTDNEILDGMYYDFEIISVNETDHMIRFINAHVWDYYKDQMLIDYLNKLSGDRGDGYAVP